MNSLLGILCAIGCICCIFTAAFVSKDSIFAKLLALAVALCLLLGTIVFSIESGKDKLREELAKEVKMEQVTVKGLNTFSARVMITYKDGELERVILRPETTVSDTKQ